MTKIGLFVRERIIDDIKSKVGEANACFFISFNKVKASSLTDLRNNLSAVNAKIFVAKGTLFQRALKEVGYEDLEGLIGGETGVVTCYDEDVVGACKVLVEFAKESEILKIKGGLLGDNKMSDKDVAALSKLPSREVLLSMALRGMVSPLTGLLSTFNQIILKFVWVVDAIKKNKEK